MKINLSRIKTFLIFGLKNGWIPLKILNKSIETVISKHLFELFCSVVNIERKICSKYFEERHRLIKIRNSFLKNNFKKQRLDRN